jgi:hypothetical protein
MSDAVITTREAWSPPLIGALIGGAFGMALMVANADTPLGAPFAVALRALAIAAFMALLVVVGRARRRTHMMRSRDRGSQLHPLSRPFEVRYWIVVAVEVVLLLTGLLILRLLGAPQQTYIAWIALVVGSHFLAFGFIGIWPRSIARPGAILVVLGLASFALAATPAADWVPLLAGVLSGATLLSASLSAAART